MSEAGHCHHGGHGGGHGGVGIGTHADQSPSWNMAMQTEQMEIELGRRLTLNDPRILIGLTIFVFLTLLLLPYTLDYLQTQYLSGWKAEVVPDSEGPSAAVLSMVGTTMTGKKVSLDKTIKLLKPKKSETVSQKTAPESDSTKAPLESDNAEDALDPHKMPGLVKESRDKTIEEMLKASGLNSSALAKSSGFGETQNTEEQVAATQTTSTSPASYGVPVAAAQESPVEYGGAIPINQQYYLYVPNQQQTLPNQQAVQSVQAQDRAANLNIPSSQATYSQAPDASRGLAYSQVPAASAHHPNRNAFNAETSAIIAPRGMRHQSFEQSQQTTSADGQRLRVWVSR